MILDSIQLRGWMPFAGEFELTLPAGPIAVVGMHSGDLRRSNRAGKTAFLEAIDWCLFGVHRKRLDDDIINKKCDAVEVRIRVADLIIKRSKPRGSSTRLEVLRGDEMIVGDLAQQAIEKTIGLTFDDYVATSRFRQGDVESIITRTADKRLQLVSEWLEQKRWITARELQAKKHSTLENHLTIKRTQLQAEETYAIKLGEKIQLSNELALLEKSLVEQRQVLVDVQDKLNARENDERQWEVHREIEKLRAHTSNMRLELQKRGETERRLKEAQEVAKPRIDDANAAYRAFGELEVVRRTGFSGECPVTCKQCPVKDTVEATVRESSELFEQRRTYAEELKRSATAAKAVITSIECEVRDFDRMATRYAELVERGRTLRASVTKKPEELVSINSADTSLFREEERLEKFVDEGTRRAGELRSKIDAGMQHEKQREILAKLTTQLERECRVSQLALRAISSIPSRIAQEQLGELEESSNTLLAGSGVTIRFGWMRELGDKAPLCNECGHVYVNKRGDECPQCGSSRGRKTANELEILCDDGGGFEEDVRFNSGGTRAVVGAAIRLAASLMLRRLRGSQAAWAIVDEPFGSLDAANRESLASTFSGMLGSVGLQQALVVSHDPALLNALPYRIEIDKDGDASTLRVV